MNSLLIKRPVAYFIDFIIIWGTCILPQFIIYRVFDGMPFTYFHHPYHVYFWVLCTVSIPVWLYFIILESSPRQSTIGKRFMHLKVAGYSNTRISKKKSFVRTLVKLLPWEITHIGLLPIYFSDNPQPTIGLYLANGLIIIYLVYFISQKGKTTIHDKAAGTKVILSA